MLQLLEFEVLLGDLLQLHPIEGLEELDYAVIALVWRRLTHYFADHRRQVRLRFIVVRMELLEFFD
jgi:hypothetical protein